MNRPELKVLTKSVLTAMATMFVSAPFAAHAQQATDFGTAGATGSSTNSKKISDMPAVKAAPIQSSLDARSAQSEINEAFIKDFTSPVSDFSQIVQMAPGLFSVSPNGPGLGDTKTFFRGFKDGQYTISFDGIPFADTNDPTHHSWAFFPKPFVGGALVDRSPGTAATIGQATFGGTIALQSRDLDLQQRATVFGSIGTWNTKMYGGEFDTGAIGKEGTSNLLFNIHRMTSDGYQTYNRQERNAFSLKYQAALSDYTSLTLFGSYIDLRTRTPNGTTPTRGDVALYGDNYLANNDPTQVNYWGYGFYHVTTDFEYIGVTSNLGNGWKLEDKLYTYAYHNQQNYDSKTPISATSAVDKLNAYRTDGTVLRVSQESSLGTFRAGMWWEVPATNRYQVPSDPRTWVDAALPNFHERISTTNTQPFVEFEFNVSKDLKITPGLKYTSFHQDLTQYADNGKTVGNLGGKPFTEHSATYTAFLPALDMHYMIQNNWSAYAQFATGSVIPPTSVFDTKNASVSTLPAPTKTKTYQFGTVYKTDAFTVDADAYYIRFDNAYSSTLDAQGNAVYFSNGESVTKGIEAEGTIILGGGFSTYLNATFGSAKYSDNGLWVANAPSDTQTASLTYDQGPWRAGAFVKRVGRQYADAGGTHQAATIDAYALTNLFVNYTIDKPFAGAKQAKLQFGINNLFDKHSITNVSPVTPGVASNLDQLTLLPARSLSLAVSIDF